MLFDPRNQVNPFTPYQGYRPYQNYPAMQPTQTLFLISENTTEAESYPVAPNSAVAIWVRKQGCIYIKQADPMGQQNVTILDAKERGREPAEEAPKLATKTDVEALFAAIRGIEDTLFSMSGKKKEAESNG